MRILVATDLSDDGAVAIDVARAFRARHGGTIAIVHIVPPSTRPEMLFPQDNQPAALGGIDLQRRVNDHLRASLPEDVSDAELLVEEGKPAERLLELAIERRTELIVLGGRDPGETRVFGSVAESVLTHTTIPVLIARRHPDTGEVIVATDLTDDGMVAVNRAVEIASKTGARVTAVHVTSGPPEDVELQRVRAALPPAGTIEIESGNAAAAIVAVAERHNAELIVVASRGRKGLARFTIGSVASSVVRKASCSVLVVPVAR